MVSAAAKVLGKGASWHLDPARGAAVASVLTLAVLLTIACASSDPSSQGGSSSKPGVAQLTSVSVDSSEWGTMVSLLGPQDAVYSAVFNDDLRAVVLDIAAVESHSDQDLVEVYDGLVDYVTISSYSEGASEPITRVEVALAMDADFEVVPTDDGLLLTVNARGLEAAEGASDSDPWANAPAQDDAEVVAGESTSDSLEVVSAVVVPDPPVATQLDAVDVMVSDEGVLVHLMGNGTIWAVESFVLENPDRFVMDLAGMSKQTTADRVDVGHALVDRVRVGSHSDKVRVVIDGGAEASGFDSRSVKPSADGVFIALGTGEALASNLEGGIAAAQEAWRKQALASSGEVPGELSIVEAGDEPPSAQWDEQTEAVASKSVLGETEEITDANVMKIEQGTTVVAAVSEDMTRIHGIHYQTMDDLDRVAVMSESAVDYMVHEPDADTLVVSFPESRIENAVAGHIKGRSGGPVSLVSVFQQPDVEVPQVRLVISRAANQAPEITRKGSLLFIDFADLGVAAVMPPAFPDIPMVASTSPSAQAADEAMMAANDGGVTTATVDELPEFSDNPSLDGPAGMDQAFSATQDSAPASFEPMDGPIAGEPMSDEMAAMVNSPMDGPASLEPPAAVEVLQEGGLVDGKRYSGRRISLDFNDVPISDVLRLIAEVSDLNLIAGDEVKGSVTIRLVDVPWDQALDVVLLTKGLGFIRVGNILRVAPSDIIKQEEELRLQERRNKEKLEDLMVKLLPVNYAAVKQMEGLVKRLLSSRGTVNIDERTNTLIIKDIASVIDEAVALVKAVDTETPQVMIEAKIVEAALDFARELGSEWSIGTQPSVDPFTGNTPRSDLGGEDFRFHGDNSVSFSNPITLTPTAAMNLGAYLLDEQLDLDVKLRAAESMGQGKVISSPRVVTLDNSEAMIEQGVSIPFQTFESGDAKLEFVDAVLSLKVTPHITADRSIIMDLEVTRNAPDDSVSTPTGSPAISKAETNTETLVKDGQTLVIGGIYTIVKSERSSRVPYLYRIPVIGVAFRSKEVTDTRKELLIFITPQIVKSPEIAGK